MGLFNKKKNENDDSEVIDGLAILEKYDKGELDNQAFLREFRKVTLQYSTPYGDHIDGGQRPFVLPDEGNSYFLPAFTSMERAKEFFDKAGRNGYILMNASFQQLIETSIKINRENKMLQFGLVIDPGYSGITLKASMLEGTLIFMRSFK